MALSHPFKEDHRVLSLSPPGDIHSIWYIPTAFNTLWGTGPQPGVADIVITGILLSLPRTPGIKQNAYCVKCPTSGLRLLTLSLLASYSKMFAVLRVWHQDYTLCYSNLHDMTDSTTEIVEVSAAARVVGNTALVCDSLCRCWKTAAHFASHPVLGEPQGFSRWMFINKRTKEKKMKCLTTENVQIFPIAGFIWLCCQCLKKRSPLLF